MSPWWAAKTVSDWQPDSIFPDVKLFCKKGLHRRYCPSGTILIAGVQVLIAARKLYELY